MRLNVYLKAIILIVLLLFSGFLVYAISTPSLTVDTSLTYQQWSVLPEHEKVNYVKNYYFKNKEIETVKGERLVSMLNEMLEACDESCKQTAMTKVLDNMEMALVIR